jgi:flagellar biosynthesis protein FlhA
VIKSFLENNKDLALVVGMVLILIVLFSPIPPVLLDLAIILNFGLALTILLLTFYVKKPVDFSTFPSLLLIATLFRLSMNVAATRLILTGGEAGQVIGSIGSFAVGGNFIVGMVVFSILIVVQYVVVTSGAQRVSEVAARFTLDSMPGQQMSIDADLNMGLIDQDEALQRREEVEKEAAFYGSMDGASKFVKGDSIAGIIILLIDILAGWIIGVAQMGMGWSEALQTFSLLTIGDGIATQLPALIIAIATGIIVTRSSADTELSTEVLKQLSSVTRIPLIVAGILCLLLLLPGMPKWPIVLLIGFTVFVWLRIRQNRIADEPEEMDSSNQADEDVQLAAPVPLLELALGRELTDAWIDQKEMLLERIAALREVQEQKLGLGFPPVKLQNRAGLAASEYEIRIFGTRYAGGELDPRKVLAIRGDRAKGQIEGAQTVDPAFGLPAIWIEEDQTDGARDSGYTIVDPLTALITHLGEIMKTEAATMLTRSTVVKMTEGVSGRQSGLIDELIPNQISLSDLQQILKNLLSEGISIANIDLIAEHLVDLTRTEKDAGRLTEAVRQRMSYAICNQLKDRHKNLAVLSLDPRVENQISSTVQANPQRPNIIMEPKLTEQLLRRLAALSNDMLSQGRTPVLLCGAEIRRQMRNLTERSIPKLSILSISEIPRNIELQSFEVVKIDATT